MYIDSIIVKGGKPIIGDIYISGSKNASLPLMVLSLLTDEKLVLTNVPKLSDISTMCHLLSNHGTKINKRNNKYYFELMLSSENIHNFLAPYDIVNKMRASIWVLGPLLTRFGHAKVSLPGGCAIGARQVNLHLAIMEAFGTEIAIKNGYILASAKNRLIGCNFKFSIQSVGATINAILAAVLAVGESNLLNCAIEPEISDVCRCLNAMGAEVYGIGTTHIKIIGKDKLSGTKYNVLPDRIEAGTYMIAAAITRGDILLKGIQLSILENLAFYMRKAGVYIEQEGDAIRIKHSGTIKPVNIETNPYPGFSTDLQAQFMTFMLMAEGKSKIQENIFENRFMHVPELCRMGAKIKIYGNRAIVHGVSELKGTEVVASDLRASVSLVIAGLVAKGTTTITRVYHLDRGYQSLETKLQNCGADIIRFNM